METDRVAKLTSAVEAQYAVIGHLLDKIKQLENKIDKLQMGDGTQILVQVHRNERNKIYGQDKYESVCVLRTKGYRNLPTTNNVSIYVTEKYISGFRGYGASGILTYNYEYMKDEEQDSTGWIDINASGKNYMIPRQTVRRLNSIHVICDTDNIEDLVVVLWRTFGENPNHDTLGKLTVTVYIEKNHEECRADDFTARSSECELCYAIKSVANKHEFDKDEASYIYGWITKVVFKV